MSEKLSFNSSEQPSGNYPEIKKEDELKKTSEVLLNYLRVEDPPEKSDCIFILGGASLASVQKGAELYKQGYSEKIAFISTGGKFGGNKVWGVPEDKMYKKTLLELGIPENSIVSEGKTSNTLAEAKAAIPFLEENGIDPKKIILVSRPIHQRRAWATFSQQHPEVKYINCPADEMLDLTDLDTQKRLVAEAERLLAYAKNKDIEKQEIPLEILKAAATIRKSLKKGKEYQQ